MAKTWILVAESSRAKIYRTDNRNDPLQEVEDLVHPQSRQHEKEMSSDLPGSNKGGGASHHHFDEATSIKEHEVTLFAKQVAERLETGRSKGDFYKLIIVAAPSFLGHLRKCLSSETVKLVSEEINKNLLQHSPADIHQHVKAAI